MTTVTLPKPTPHPTPGSVGAIGTFENLFRLTTTDTTELIFVRHAEPDYSAAKASDVIVDPPLTERGRLQSARLAQRMRNMDIAAIYSSTMRRAIETAAIIAAEKDLPIISAPKLREIGVSHRIARNGQAADSQTLSSEVLVQFLNNPRWDAIEGMEPSREFRQRVIQTVHAIISRRAGERVVIVSHAGVINAYLSTILDIQRDMFFLPEHASLTVVRVLQDIHAVQNINDFSHLLPTFALR